MKIKYVKGDVTEADATIIAHGCNAQGVMGSGVAKIIREKYPEAYDAYRNMYYQGGLELGNVIIAQSNGKRIANCITQEFFGTDRRHADYDAIRTVMRTLDVRALGGTVAMPLIGAGLAGGDWKVISKIIEESFKNSQPVVYVFDKEHEYLLEDKGSISNYFTNLFGDFGMDNNDW